MSYVVSERGTECQGKWCHAWSRSVARSVKGGGVMCGVGVSREVGVIRSVGIVGSWGSEEEEEQEDPQPPAADK